MQVATAITYFTAPWRLIVLIAFTPVAAYVFFKTDGGE